jgi:hypothetical protein
MCPTVSSSGQLTTVVLLWVCGWGGGRGGGRRDILYATCERPVCVLVSVYLLRSDVIHTASCRLCDVVHLYGFCDGNAVHAAAEYQRRFPNPKSLPDAARCRYTRDVRVAAECEVNEDVDGHDSIVQSTWHCAKNCKMWCSSGKSTGMIALCSPRDIARRTARCDVRQARVWTTVHAEGRYPYHVQRVWHLRYGDFAQRLEFCSWLNGNRRLHRYIVFTDKAQFCHNNVHNAVLTVR